HPSVVNPDQPRGVRLPGRPLRLRAGRHRLAGSGERAVPGPAAADRPGDPSRRGAHHLHRDAAQPRRRRGAGRRARYHRAAAGPAGEPDRPQHRLPQRDARQPVRSHRRPGVRMNDPNATAHPVPGIPVIQAAGLSVAYDSARVLADVDLTVRSGEALALLGANGSGKSTLMRALLGIVPVTAGQARLFGTPVTSRRAVPWERIGYVPQRVAAPSGVPATAGEVVLTGL